MSTPEQDAKLLAFMRSWEPVVQVPPDPVLEHGYRCRCGNAVARSGALCISCANTNWLGQRDRQDTPAMPAQRTADVGRK